MAPRKTHILKVTQQGQHGFYTAEYTLTDPRGTASDRRRSLMPTIAIFSFIFVEIIIIIIITHCSHFLLNYQLPTGFVLVG